MAVPPHHAHWPAGLPRSLEYPRLPVGAVVAGAARRFGDRTAFHYAGRDLSFTELERRANAFAHALRSHGIGRGDVVAVHLPNCLQYPVVYYGILLAGAVFSPTNPWLPPDDLAFQLADSGAVAAVTHGEQAATLAGVLDRTSVRLAVLTDRTQSLDPSARVDTAVLGDAGVDLEAMIDGRPGTPPAGVELDVDRDLAHITYTGGTTGRSKGVELPHRNVLVNALQFACWGYGAVPGTLPDGGVVIDQIGVDDDWLVPLGTGVTINVTPWFHAMGTISALSMPVLAGVTTVIHDGLDPGAFLADVERFRATSVTGAPPLFAMLLAHPDSTTRDLSSVVALVSAAAPMPTELLAAVRRRFPDAVVAEAYGLTEVSMGATMGPMSRTGTRKPGSVGLPVFDTQVKIVSLDGATLPAGEPGEVCIRGPQVMRGYRNRPDDTDDVLVDGWLRTGDIGVLDHDGHLAIVDRKKDVLLYKGYNVYPRELEELLFAQPGVANAAVVGRPDPVAGELPVAFVVRAPGSEVDADALLAAVNARVVHYKRLREIRFVDWIPISAAGKILKRELVRQL